LVFLDESGAKTNMTRLGLKQANLNAFFATAGLRAAGAWIPFSRPACGSIGCI